MIVFWCKNWMLWFNNFGIWRTPTTLAIYLSLKNGITQVFENDLVVRQKEYGSKDKQTFVASLSFNHVIITTLLNSLKE
jgi:hypothetical protein